MILILDTETTGLPANYQAPISDTENWPRAVQIAWRTFENDGTEIIDKCFTIRPEGYEIPAEAAALHGITTEKAVRDGWLIDSVIEFLSRDLSRADRVVAHNLDFDKKIIGAEYFRTGKPDPFEKTINICTMKAATEYCAIPGKNGGYKWPKLSELYLILFGETIEGEHNAEADVRATARCYFELVKREVIDPGFAKAETKPEPMELPTKQVKEFALPTELLNLVGHYEQTLIIEHSGIVALADAHAAVETEKARVLVDAYTAGLIDGKTVGVCKLQETRVLENENGLYWLEQAERDAQMELDRAEIERKTVDKEIEITKAWLYSRAGVR